MRRGEIERHLQISSHELLHFLGELSNEEWDNELVNLSLNDHPSSKISSEQTDTSRDSYSDSLITEVTAIAATTTNWRPFPSHEPNLPAIDKTPTNALPTEVRHMVDPLSARAHCLDDQNQKPDLPVNVMISSLSELKTILQRIDSNVQKIMARQKALSESVKYIYSVISPSSIASSPRPRPDSISTPHSTRPTPSSSESAGTTSTPRPPAPAIIPIYISSTDKNGYLLGGVEGMVRNIADYNTAVRKVASRAASKPDAMGRILCSVLVRLEFSDEELAQKNISERTRERETKRIIPTLDKAMIHATFLQAKLQFPDFTNSHTNSGCQTVQLINDTCKHIRRIWHKNQ